MMTLLSMIVKLLERRCFILQISKSWLSEYDATSAVKGNLASLLKSSLSINSTFLVFHSLSLSVFLFFFESIFFLSALRVGLFSRSSEHRSQFFSLTFVPFLWILILFTFFLHPNIILISLAFLSISLLCKRTFLFSLLSSAIHLLLFLDATSTIVALSVMIHLKE